MGCNNLLIIPKKDGTKRYISDSRRLNLALKRKPFPISNIQDVLQKFGRFTYATSLDLTKSPESRKLCTVIPVHSHLRELMDITGSPDIFQDRMSTLMESLEYS
jgi:hypothetical protein